MIHYLGPINGNPSSKWIRKCKKEKRKPAYKPNKMKQSVGKADHRQ